MNFVESLQSALQNIKSNKMRSVLTMLGIIIGISSVITIIALATGGKNYLNNEFSSLGTNIVNLSMKSGDTFDARDYYTLQDVDLIKNKVPEVTDVMATINGFGYAKTESKSKRAQIVASNMAFYGIRRLEMLSGRFMNERDLESLKSVGVIDDITADKLFHNGDPIGQKVTVNSGSDDLSVTVIGVCKSTSGGIGKAFGDNAPGMVIVPITIANKLLENTYINGLSIVLSDMSHSQQVTNNVIKLLENKHKNSDKYVAAQGFSQFSMIDNILNMFTLIMSAIAGISLLVGGIGVMNIMLVSVTERTREIGIRKAIGAKTKDIKIQFLTEALVICFIGGFIGIVIGLSVGAIVGKLINVSAVPSPISILAAFLFSSAIGIFFGYYPATKAAKLDPIEALRCE